MNAEIKQKKWFWGGIALQLATGFTVGFLVYQIGTVATTGAVGAGLIGGLVFVAAFAAVLAWLCVRSDRKLKAEALAGKK
jgi:ferrous iron transport protein B